MSPQELARQFAADRTENDDGARRQLWVRYRDGLITPRSAPTKKELQKLAADSDESRARDFGTVNLVDKRYPGTARWFDLSLWGVLATEIDYFRQDFNPVSGMPKRFIAYLEPFAFGIHPRPRGSNYILTPEVQEILGSMEPEFAIEALTMLLWGFHRAIEITHDERSGAAKAYLRLAEILARDEVMGLVHHELFTLIEQKYFTSGAWSCIPIARAKRRVVSSG